MQVNNPNSETHLVSLKSDRQFNSALTSWPNTISSEEEFFGLALSLASRLEDEGLQGLNKALGSLGEISLPDFLNLILLLREVGPIEFEQVSGLLYKSDLNQLQVSLNSFFKCFDVVLNTSIKEPKIYNLGKTALANLLLDLLEINLEGIKLN